MAATKRWITIARPGTFHYSWGDEEKTAEDLKEAIPFSPLLKLTMGHPKGGRTRRRDFLGFVKPKWNEALQTVEGMAWFYEEHLDKIPENIRRKIVNFQPYKISPGFTLDDESDSGGPQKGTMFDHVAILRDGENPICPLDQCGVNVRLESESMPKMILEQEQTVENKDTNTTATVAPENAAPEASSELDALKAEVAELKAQILNQKQPQPSAPEPEVKVEDKGPEVAVGEKTEAPPPEPAMVIPAGTLPSEKKDFTVDSDGWIRMELPSKEQENK